MTSSHRLLSAKAVSASGSERLPRGIEFVLLVLMMFVYAGEPPPMVNEAHYLVKAKNFWQPEWCAEDLFVVSAKAHTTFYALFGWPTLACSLETTAWLGRLVGWSMLAWGLQRLCHRLIPTRGVALGVAVLWMVGVDYGNLAGEWVVGGIEAKVPAYGLILLALAEMVDRRWHRVWPLLGAASAFHVLSGGWSVVAAMCAWWITEWNREDRGKLFSPSLFLGGAISLFGLVPAVALTLGANSEDATAAARIYAYFRIKHHLLPADFLLSWYLRHGLLIAATVAIAFWERIKDPRWIRMEGFTFGAVTIALIGLLVGLLPPLIPDLAARLLRFYWFRLTDAVVPLMFALLVIRWIVGGRTSQFEAGPTVERAVEAAAISAIRRKRMIGILVLSLAIAMFAVASYQKHRLGIPPSVSSRLLGWDSDASVAEQRRVAEDWRAVCRWVKTSTPEDEVFLTPRHQQTFKWYAERGEVVNWKDVPQDAANLREWYQRFVEVFPRRLGRLRVTIRYDALRELRQRYGVRYLVVDRRVSGANLPLVQVYPARWESNSTFAVYRMPN